MMKAFDHVAIIVSDYETSKSFYIDTLGLTPIAETYRAARDSWKLDLAIPGGGQLEVFTFPDAPERVSRPEARGLRHLAFQVSDIEVCVARLEQRGITVEPVRLDELTGCRFTFFADPDALPIELYEVPDH
ncbi:MAG: VOC family protein [Pseudomonadota bacterium]